MYDYAQCYWGLHKISDLKKNNKLLLHMDKNPCKTTVLTFNVLPKIYIQMRSSTKVTVDFEQFPTDKIKLSYVL